MGIDAHAVRVDTPATARLDGWPGIQPDSILES
jgi:hypothetical protein